MPPTIFPAASPALPTADPADDVTRDRPSCALDAVAAVFSFAALATSDVEDALRKGARRRSNCCCRITARERQRDIVALLLWRRGFGGVWLGAVAALSLRALRGLRVSLGDFGSGKGWSWGPWRSLLVPTTAFDQSTVIIRSYESSSFR
jgi:hypothetical protein